MGIRLEDEVENTHLRWALEEITMPGDWDRLHRQISRIRALHSAYPHRLSILEEHSLGHQLDFNCFRYALCLIDLPRSVTDLMLRPDRPTGPVDSKFVLFLIGAAILEEISSESTVCGDIVVYSTNNQPKHAGRVAGDLVDSKWGPGGHLWRHGIYEIPLKYGSEARFFRSISSQTTYNALICYARHTEDNELLDALTVCGL